jgi:hypothetical protein
VACATLGSFLGKGEVFGASRSQVTIVVRAPVTGTGSLSVCRTIDQADSRRCGEDRWESESVH